jgi:hypothetical protein
VLDLVDRIIQALRDLIARILELILRWLRPRPSSEPPPATCPIGWQPSVLAPVFYGVREVGREVDAPVACRIFFPSLDGAVFDAPILEGCGRYPLIVFAHGNCSEPTGDHYRKWFELPAQLARSGYVVVAPMLAGTAGGSYPWDNNAELALLRDTVAWMRTGWEHKAVLLPAPATGVAGHSYGALLGLRLAVEGSVSAYASLSGPWSEWPSIPPNPIGTLGVPKLFMWGSGFGDTLSQFDSGWAGLSTPKHKGVLRDAGHWDYLPAGRSACEVQRGPCTVAWALAGDVVSTFFASYLPPERWPSLGQQIPDSLVPPPLNLTNDQQFFAGGHLTAFGLLGTRPECGITLSWATPGGSGSVSRP